MTDTLPHFTHVLGLVLIGAGLIGVFVTDLRSRQLRDLALFAEAIRNIAVFYDGLVVPGAVLLAGSGIWLIVSQYGGWQFLEVPWLAGMVGLFLFEFIEGNTVTRLYFLRLRRLSREALENGRVSAELEQARRHHLPTFTHFLDLPVLFVIVALGATRPQSWSALATGLGLAVVMATVLTLILPRLYPWQPGK
ncbi:MAG: DUF2269 domain-containing protein [Rhodospirillales bacterium]|nr:DUF2269 domain-containing protein [Rhodospirillales bacterium]